MNSYGDDFEDRLTSFNGGAVTMVYDGDGNRVVRTEGGVATRYLVDDLKPTGYAQVAEEVQAGAVARRYVYGTQRIGQTQLICGAWTTHYYGYDGGFSVWQLSDSAGAVTDTYTYDAFGSTIGSSGTTPHVFLYRGEMYDQELVLYNLRARYLVTLTGRFITMDPNDGRDDYPETLHEYLYTGGDPVAKIDPTGRGFLSYIARVYPSVKPFVVAVGARIFAMKIFCYVDKLLDYAVASYCRVPISEMPPSRQRGFCSVISWIPPGL